MPYFITSITQYIVRKFYGIKEPKTNWKYILIVMVLAVIVGLIALFCLAK